MRLPPGLYRKNTSTMHLRNLVPAAPEYSGQECLSPVKGASSTSADSVRLCAGSPG